MEDHLPPVPVVRGGRSSLTAATLTVDLNGGADYTDIQTAIDAAADGDTVLVKPGEYVITEPINFNRLHDPDESREPAGEEHRREVGGRGGGDDDPDVGDAGGCQDRASVVVFENAARAADRCWRIQADRWGASVGEDDGDEIGEAECRAVPPPQPHQLHDLGELSGAWGEGGGVYCG